MTMLSNFANLFYLLFNGAILELADITVSKVGITVCFIPLDHRFLARIHTWTEKIIPYR